MNCNGEETRIRIVSEYTVRPIAHIQLLAGQTKRSDAGPNITDKYFLFECTKKSNPEIKDTIICGHGAGNHFLSLTKQKAPSVFNPLKTLGTGGGGNGGDGDGGGTEAWNDVAKQLHNAIQWIIVCRNKVPHGPLLSIKQDLEKYSKYEPFLGKIKAINTIIARLFDNKTLTAMIDELRVENDLKHYDFRLLVAKLDEDRTPSYF